MPQRTVLRATSLPKVQIMLSNQTPWTTEEAVQALDTVLAMNGIAMVNVGEKFVSAVPTTGVLQEGVAFARGEIKDLAETGQFVCPVHLDPGREIPCGESPGGPLKGGHGPCEPRREQIREARGEQHHDAGDPQRLEHAAPDVVHSPGGEHDHQQPERECRVKHGSTSLRAVAVAPASCRRMPP